VGFESGEFDVAKAAAGMNARAIPMQPNKSAVEKSRGDLRLRSPSFGPKPQSRICHLSSMRLNGCALRKVLELAVQPGLISLGRVREPNSS
jgi:hypothetical protein